MSVLRFRGTPRKRRTTPLTPPAGSCGRTFGTPANENDFALVAMLGPLGLWTFEATGTCIADPGEEHGHRVPRVCGKGTKVVLVPLPGGRPGHRPRHRGPRQRADPAQQPRHPDGPARRHPPPAPPSLARGRADHPATSAMTTMLDAGVDLRDVQIAARHADLRTTTRHGARQNLDRHPNYILAAYMASGT